MVFVCVTVCVTVCACACMCVCVWCIHVHCRCGGGVCRGKSVEIVGMYAFLLFRKSFEAERQFAMLCRILIDQTQPMNHKVKLAWLEYMHELLPLLDSTDFKDTTGKPAHPSPPPPPFLRLCVCVPLLPLFLPLPLPPFCLHPTSPLPLPVTDSRQALGRLLAFTMEPKSAEIRRSSQKTVTGLFELNPATLTLMLPSVPKPLQESANKILKGYMQVCTCVGAGVCSSSRSYAVTCTNTLPGKCQLRG